MDCRKILILIVCCCVFLVGIFMGVRWICTLCHDKAVAECQAATASTIATSAEKRQQITEKIKKISVSERRKVLQRWIID